MYSISIILIAITVLASLVGFSNAQMFDRLKFNVGAILGRERQWDRLISSAFVHADYMHLIFNMMTLYFFADIVIDTLESWGFLVVYFGAVLGGGLLSLWLHRRQPYYSAIGASGGVVGILFAAIAIEPHMGVGIFFIPIAVPGWIFGIIYIGISIYAMHKEVGNIGHDAHLGGAAVGILLSSALAYEYLMHNILYVSLMCIPLLVLVYYVWIRKDNQ